MNIEEKIKQYRENGFPEVWVSDLGNGNYKNPLIFTDYSDPDIIKVEDDFFMTASSFNSVPGLPILHSKDLVNWTLVGYALEEIPFPGYDMPQYGKAVWAPSMRYHNGYYYIYVGFPDEGIMMVRTKDPFGKWEKPICLKETRGYIDTCPLWDDDGNAYLVNAFARSRIGFKSVLAITKMNADGTALTDEFRIVYDGNANNPTIEGPKLYKRNGYYYISAPAGGVATGWQLVLRSKHIYGPYEEKIVLHQGNTNVNGPHQGGFVDLEGESWFLHFQSNCGYGRIVHLQPMRWEDDWPVMGINQNENGVGEPVMTYKKPSLPSQRPTGTPASDDFNGCLRLQWQWNANPKSEWYSLSENPGHLRLYAVNEGDGTIGSLPNILTQKFPAECFTVIAKMQFSPECPFEKCGLLALGKEYFALSLTNTKQGILLNRIEGEIQDFGRTVNEIFTYSENLESPQYIYLKLDVKENSIGTLSFSTDSENFKLIGTPFTATINEWMGAKIGLFCNAGKTIIKSSGFVDIDWVLVEE